MKKAWIFVFLIIFALPSYAEKIYLKARGYLDLDQAKIIHPAVILIEDGRIRAINPEKMDSKTKRIEIPTLILLPGLIDMHVHLPIDTPTYALSFVQDDAAMATLRAVKNAKTLLMAGFTTIRCLGQIYAGPHFIDIAIGKAGDAGWIPAPRIISAGNALGITGGIMDPDMIGGYAPNTFSTSYKNGVADGIDEVIKATRYQIKYGAKVIKIGATSGVLAETASVGNQEYSYDEIKAIVEEARRKKIPVAAHAHGVEGIKTAVKAGVDSIEHGSLLDAESINLMIARGTFLVPTLGTGKTDFSDLNPLMRKKAEYIVPLAKENTKKAIKAGVKIAFGSDAPAVVPHGENAKALTAFVNLGMSPIDVIRIATIHAAKLLRVQDRGQIKPSYLADIIGVEDNPLVNIRTLEEVAFVMKDGKIYKMPN